jgi:opacity protein-like surface antigen
MQQRLLRRAVGLAVAVLCLILGVTGSAGAQVEAEEWDDSYYPYTREGIYFGVGGLFALENFDTDAAIEDPANQLDISADDGGGFALRGGYRVHPNFAGEVLFQYYADFQVKERNSGFDDQFDGWSLTLNGKLYPLGGRFQPYVVAGVGGIVFTEKKGDDSGFLARMGGGLDFYVNDAFVIDLEIAYLFPAGSISELQFVTFAAGVQYRY